MLVALVASLISLLTLWNILSLIRNVRRAKSSGLKVVISPVSAYNPLWMILNVTILPFLTRLGFGFNGIFKLTNPSWNFYDRYKMHQKYGKVFAHATPSNIEIFVADAASSYEVLARKKDFGKPMHFVEIINIFGPTVASTDGPDWYRHRRITATPFNERNNAIVWRESVKQATQMLSYFKTTVGTAGSTGLGDDTMTLTLHILTSVGLGFSYDFRGTQEQRNHNEVSDAGHTLSYRDCLAAVLENFVLMQLLPKKIFSLPWLPQKLKEFLLYKGELKRYLTDMVEKTRYEGSRESNLLSVLVQKNEEARQLKGSTAEGAGVKQGLSDNELYGNLFVYSFAGHETTAHAICYAIYFLAAYPEVQDWVSEEVNAVFRSVEDPEVLSYELFPQLKRTLGVMYETLRLFPPLLNIPKTTGALPQDLRVPSANLTAALPAEAMVFPNVAALQSHPDYWGPDSLDWKPARWIEKGPEGAAEGLEGLGESMRAPVKGSFLPWGDGPRVCPGRKFSQVEFVAVVASVLWRHRIEVVPDAAAGEGFAEAKARILDVMGDVAEGSTLFMKHPERVRVRVVER